MNHPELEQIASKAREHLDRIDAAREDALAVSRQITRAAATAIKHVHRQEPEKARALLEETAEAVAALNERLSETPVLWFAGFVQDGLKELAEAQLTYCIVRGEKLPTPEEIGVSPASYLNGLAEAIGEMRRRALDLIRTGRAAEAEQTLDEMDELYATLMTFDYPNAVSLGLRSRVDAARGLVERTRGDVTNALQQARLEEKMGRLRSHIEDST
jgi:translin